METVYIDVLLIMNIYVNFFLLRTTSALTHSPLSTGRCLAASVYGSLFSLLILAPKMEVFLSSAIRLSAAVSIVAAAFGVRSSRRLLLNTLAFFGSNFILAGTVYAVYSWFAPDFMHFNNSYFYIDFSLIILVLTTSALYAAVRAVRFFLDKAPPGSGCYKVTVRYKKSIVTMEGIADTGNSLVDFFSGSPVIVCDREKFTVPQDTELPRGFRLIPCSTVSDSGVIPIFRPDEVMIQNVLSGERKPVDAVIGLGKSSGSAIFNPRLLKL